MLGSRGEYVIAWFYENCIMKTLCNKTVETQRNLSAFSDYSQRTIEQQEGPQSCRSVAQVRKNLSRMFPGQGEFSGNSTSGNWRNLECLPPGNQENPISHGTPTPYEAPPSRAFFNNHISGQGGNSGINTPSGIRRNLQFPPSRNQEIPNGRGTPIPSRNTPSHVSWNSPFSGQGASGTPSGIGRHLQFPQARNQETPYGRGTSTPSRVYLKDPSSGQGGNSGINTPSGIGRNLQFLPRRNQETPIVCGTFTSSRNNPSHVFLNEPSSQSVFQANQRQPNNFVPNGTTAIGGLRHQNAAPSAPPAAMLSARTPAPRFFCAEWSFENEAEDIDLLFRRVEELEKTELYVPASQAQSNPPRCQSSGQDQFSSQTQNLIAEFNVHLQSVVRFRHLLGLAKVIHQMVATYHQVQEPFLDADGFPQLGLESSQGITILWNEYYSRDTKAIESIQPYFQIKNENTRTVLLAYVAICSDKDEKQALNDLRLKFRQYCASLKGIKLNIVRVLPFAWIENFEGLSLPEELKDLPFNPLHKQMLLEAVSTTVAPVTASHRVPKIFS